jgi:DNA-binding IscR family transcriptional regulator
MYSQKLQQACCALLDWRCKVKSFSHINNATKQKLDTHMYWTGFIKSSRGQTGAWRLGQRASFACGMAWRLLDGQARRKACNLRMSKHALAFHLE